MLKRKILRNWMFQANSIDPDLAGVALNQRPSPPLVVDRSSSRLYIYSSFMSVMHVFRLCLLNSINLQCVKMLTRSRDP
jgi:hypothetical protein